MISQIQPHFIYNTLGSIGQLCLEQPEKAASLTQDFSQYLRGNFSELDNNKPILLSKELEHVNHYINIERVRFPDITVNFDVRCDDFFLPALSVQPLVENSIKHGLMGLESGGSVGAEDVLLHAGIRYSLNTELVDCDYFRFLQFGKPSFSGEYMKQYSWAEETCAMLLNRGQ